ncbi:MAG: hypothetical protein A2Z74_06855 [Chloroflexi bacterium RBG_13_46_9]|nr:MAG: hypothetical protein A2Z74_06855 [Chloroflexi bacterium RBG_13_46_9]
MPKSKKRKNRYVPKPRTVQPPPAGSAQVVEQSPAQAVIQTSAAVRPGRAPEKNQPMAQTPHIGTELKIIGVVTIVLLAAIIVLYFIFR